MNNWIRRSMQVGTVSASIVLAAATAATAQAPEHHAGLFAGKVGINNQAGLVASTTAMTPNSIARGGSGDTDTDPGIPVGATPGILRRPVTTNPGTPVGAKVYNQNASAQVPATVPAAAPTGATMPIAAGTPTSATPDNGATATQVTTGSTATSSTATRSTVTRSTVTGGAVTGVPAGGGSPIVVRQVVIGFDDFDTDFDDVEFVSFRHRYPGWRHCFGGRTFRWHHGWCGNFDRFGYHGDCGCDDDFGRGFGYRRFESGSRISVRGFF